METKIYMKRAVCMVAAAMLTGGVFAAAIENVIALQRPGTGIVDIYYDLIINEGGTTTVSVSVEGGDGTVNMESLSGDIGHVAPGPARHIVWNAQADNPEKVITDLRVAISASLMDVIVDHGMRWVPRGECDYIMYDEAYNIERRIVEGGGFYIDRVPVSGALWNKVYQWATKRGIHLNSKDYSASSEVIYFHEYDVHPWIDARNQMEGLKVGYDDLYNYTVPSETAIAYIIYKGLSGGLTRAFTEGRPCRYVKQVSSASAITFEFRYNVYDQYYYDQYNSVICGGHPLFCMRYKRDTDPIQETFPPNYSDAFTIDTRMNSPTFPKDFKIIDVKSKYCDGKYGKGRKALFLNGVHVHCNVEFEVDVYGGDLVYLERVNGDEIQLEAGKFTLDVGALAPGDSFEVRACSSDGRWSQNFQLNFDVAAQKGATWTASPGKDSIQYRTIELDSFQLFDQLGGSQADPFEAQNSKFIANLVNKFKKYPHELQVGVNVCWTMDSSEGIIRGVALLGVQTSTTDNAPTFTEKIAEIKAKGGKQALKFGNVSGYIKAGVENTWSWDTGSLSWQEHENYIAINVGANGCFFRNWIPTPIPWYYSADGGVDVYLRAPIVNEGLQYAIDTDKLLYATFRIGIGVPSVLSIEGSGTGSMFMTYDTETDPNLQRLGMALLLALKAQMMGFVIPILDWTGEWNWVGGENNPIDIDLNEIVDNAMSSAITNTNSSATNTVTRDYLDNYSGTGGTGSGYGWPGIPPVTTNSYPTSYSSVKICDNGMPGPTPQASGDTPSPTTGGGSGSGSGGTSPKKTRFPKIVTLADNPNRSPRTRATIITISDMTNTTFTAEDAVWDDGTPDYHPTAARMTNGCSVVAWMNEREGKPENISLGEMMSAMEIAVAVWNDETGEWAHLNLTDNSAYDRSPVLKTATNGTAAVAWLRNAYTNYIGSASEPNQICFARYAEGAWTAETVVVPFVGRVRKLDMAYDGNRAAIVFNEEDDPGNGTTQRLCVVTGDCTTWAPCRSVAEYSVNGSAAYAYYDDEGDLQLVWNDEGVVKYGIYVDGTVVAEEIDTDGHQVPNDYVFTRAHSGRMALVWLERMKADVPAMGPVAMTYNPAYGVWTLPCALTSDGQNKTEVSAAFNDSGDLEVLYATPNAATNEQGIVETASSGFSKMTRRHGGDVAILLDDVSFSTNVFAAGETIDVSFKVKNLGDEPVSNAMIRVYDRSNGSRTLTNIVCVAGVHDGQTISSYSSYVRINELQVGQCLDLNVPWTVPGSISSQLHLYFYASATGDVMSRNNYASWTYGSADISISHVQSRTDELSSSVRHVSVALENKGLASAPSGTVVTFRRGTADGAVLATKTVGKMPAGEEGVQETGFAWDVSSITPTANVEVVHVTAVLPESVDAVERVLEADVLVDVAPVVKSPLTAYTLAYDANGGKGAMAAEQPFYDECGTLASNTFTRAGHSFAGWALSPTGDVAYADGAVRWNVPMFTRDAATLYAVWVRCAEETATTEVPVPFDWLGTYFPEATNATSDMGGQIANFEAIASRPTGKHDGIGRALTVADDYIMGTDPTNSNDVFTARIEMMNGVPQVFWTPNLNINGIARRYTVLGKTNLTDKVDWAPTNSAHRFFRVKVEMP